MRRPSASTDMVALLHIYGGQHTLNGRAEDERVDAEPGSTVRVRVINTDQGTAAVWSAAPFRVLATDGHEVNEPTDVEGQRLLIPAGGRADVAVQAPSQGAVRLHVGGSRSVLIGDPEAAVPRTPQPSETLDLLAYGAATALGVRRDGAGSHVRLRDRPADRHHRRPPRKLLDDQRADVPRRPDVPCSRRRRRGHAHPQRHRRGPSDAPARTPRRRAVPRRPKRHPAVRGGSTRSTCTLASRTRSRSSPTIRGSGATTATRSLTRSTASSRTSCTRESPRRSPSTAPRATSPSDRPAVKTYDERDDSRSSRGVGPRRTPATSPSSRSPGPTPWATVVVMAAGATAGARRRTRRTRRRRRPAHQARRQRKPARSGSSRVSPWSTRCRCGAPAAAGARDAAAVVG